MSLLYSSLASRSVSVSVSVRNFVRFVLRGFVYYMNTRDVVESWFLRIFPFLGFIGRELTGASFSIESPELFSVLVSLNPRWQVDYDTTRRGYAFESNWGYCCRLFRGAGCTSTPPRHFNPINDTAESDLNWQIARVNLCTRNRIVPITLWTWNSIRWSCPATRNPGHRIVPPKRAFKSY